MGFFDFQCQNYDCPEWEGGQNDHEEYTVYIRVPLKDHRICFLKGEYDGYGHVEVGKLVFNDMQFQNYENGKLIVLEGEYFCDRIWCSNCFKFNNQVKDVVDIEKLYTPDEFLGKEKNLATAVVKFEIEYLKKRIAENTDKTKEEILKIRLESKESLIGYL